MKITDEMVERATRAFWAHLGPYSAHSAIRAALLEVLPDETDAEWEWAEGFANPDGQWVADGEHYDNRDDAELDVREARAARMRSTLVRRRKAGPWEPVEETS